MSNNSINVLVLCADEESIESKKVNKIIEPFLDRIMIELNKRGTPNYYFIGPQIKTEYENICNDTIDKCLEKWRDKDLKFDVFIDERCPLRNKDCPNLLSDIIQIINSMGNDTKYFITDGKFAIYDFQDKMWYASPINMASVKGNNWNRFQQKTNLEVIQSDVVYVKPFDLKEVGILHYLFKTVESSSAKLYKKINKKSSKSRKSSKRQRKNTKV